MPGEGEGAVGLMQKLLHWGGMALNMHIAAHGAGAAPAYGPQLRSKAWTRLDSPGHMAGHPGKERGPTLKSLVLSRRAQSTGLGWARRTGRVVRMRVFVYKTLRGLRTAGALSLPPCRWQADCKARQERG